MSELRKDPRHAEAIAKANKVLKQHETKGMKQIKSPDTPSSSGKGTRGQKQ